MEVIAIVILACFCLLLSIVVNLANKDNDRLKAEIEDWRKCFDRQRADHMAALDLAIVIQQALDNFCGHPNYGRTGG